jgi:ribose/xylose/arabinose/galactoside ABC-type transport system permease subunit
LSRFHIDFRRNGAEEVVNASGIKVNYTKFVCYVINGLPVGLAGIIFMSRVNAGIPNNIMNLLGLILISIRLLKVLLLSWR